MRAIATITWLTFHEAWRRWMVLAALLLGVAFVILYAVGLSLIKDSVNNGIPGQFQANAYNFVLLAGLYVVHFLTIMLAIFASVDAVAGEISSHTIQTLVTKPVRRWQILLGKWVGYAVMLTLYLAVLSGGLLLATNVLVGYLPPNPVQGVGLIVLEALVLLSLSLLGGTRLSTLSNGVGIFLLYGLSFIGSWVEQIGGILQVPAAQQFGAATSYLLPVEALWRNAAALLQPPALGIARFASPFAALSPPNPAMVPYAVAYAIAALGLALLSFSRRDL